MISYEFDGYDFTMCDDGLCSKRKQCHRYLAYQQYRQDTNEDKPTLVSMLINKQIEAFDGCNLFWQHKDDK